MKKICKAYKIVIGKFSKEEENTEKFKENPNILIYL